MKQRLNQGMTGQWQQYELAGHLEAQLSQGSIPSSESSTSSLLSPYCTLCINSPSIPHGSPHIANPSASLDGLLLLEKGSVLPWP